MQPIVNVKLLLS